MCKLMTITNAKNLDLETLDIATKHIADLMSHTDTSGFGVTLLKQDNTCFARKFLKPLDASLLDSKKYPIFAKEASQDIGTLKDSDVAKSVIFHGRTSTNSVSIVNTHPIVKHGIFLSHNGVVEDSGPKYSMISSNDTEHILERLSIGVSEVEKHISGYYATMHFKEGSPELFILKDSIASLYCAEVTFFEDSKSFDSYIIATTEDLIEELCEVMGWTASSSYELKSNQYFAMVGNTVLQYQDIKPKGRSSYADSLASKSLGREIYDYGSMFSYDSPKKLNKLELKYANMVRSSAKNNSGKYSFVDDRGLELAPDEVLLLEDMELTLISLVDSEGRSMDINSFDIPKNRKAM